MVEMVMPMPKWLQRFFEGGEPAETSDTSPDEQPAAALREAAGTTVADDDEGWRKLRGDTRRDLAPLTQARMREIAAYLWQSNLVANRLVELPLAYLLAEGVKLQVKDEAAQAWLDKFWHDPINAMDLKLEKRVRELALFGEQCYPVFVNEVSGMVRLGYLDPAQIATVVTDPDNPEQPIGIVTVKDGRGKARRYRVIVNGDDDELFTRRTREIRDSFADGECFYFTVNALSSGVRGRSDLLAQADWLDAYDEFLFGEHDRARYQRAFIWDVELSGLTQEQIDARAKSIAPPAPNTVRVHNESEKWSAVSPEIGAGETAEAARLLRNHVLGGSTIPEHWFGGGGDVNRAVGAEMGEPTFKLFSMRQRTVRYILEAIARYVLRQRALAAEESGFDLNKDEFAPQAVFPEMVSRDITRYATALQQVVVGCALAVEKGYLTKKTAVRIIATVAGRLGLEIDAEQELADAIAERQAEGDKNAEDDLLPADAVPSQE
jgi:hypothetical protein